MAIAIGLASVPQSFDPIGQRRIVGHHGATIAQCTKVLRRIEAECPRHADGTDGPAVCGRQVRLAAVLDDGQMMAIGYRLDGRHVGGLSVQVDRQDGARPRSDGVFDRRRIDGQAGRIDVGEDRARAGHHDGQRRIGGRQRRGDHLVSRTDVERPQNERQRVGAAANPHAVGRAHRCGELALERFDFGTEHEPAARHDAIDGRVHRVPVLGWHERQERNATRRHAGSIRALPSTYLSK